MDGKPLPESILDFITSRGFYGSLIVIVITGLILRVIKQYLIKKVAYSGKDDQHKVRPMMWLLEKYNHPYYVVFTNTPGEIVYEDRWQVCYKVEDPEIVAVQPSWSPKD